MVHSPLASFSISLSIFFTGWKEKGNRIGKKNGYFWFGFLSPKRKKQKAKAFVTPLQSNHAGESLA